MPRGIYEPQRIPPAPRPPLVCGCRRRRWWRCSECRGRRRPSCSPACSRRRSRRRTWGCGRRTPLICGELVGISGRCTSRSRRRRATSGVSSRSKASRSDGSMRASRARRSIRSGIGVVMGGGVLSCGGAAKRDAAPGAASLQMAWDMTLIPCSVQDIFLHHSGVLQVHIGMERRLQPAHLPARSRGALPAHPTDRAALICDVARGICTARNSLGATSA